jgi:hypothetical protein
LVKCTYETDSQRKERNGKMNKIPFADIDRKAKRAGGEILVILMLSMF